MKAHTEIQILKTFCIVYFILNVILFFLAYNARSGALEYVIIYYPAFWVTSGILLIFMIIIMKIKIDNIEKKLLVFCSTPLPYLLIAVIGAVTDIVLQR